MLRLKEALNLKEENGMCVARTTRAWLIKENKGTLLYVELDDDTEFITNGRERKAHFNSVDPAWLEQQLAGRNKHGSLRVATPEHPLEIITGDVCLILKIEGLKYVLSNYRNITPKGWLVPGGLPNNPEELLTPSVVAHREVREEVLIEDDSGRVYSLDEPTREVENNIKLWGLNPTDIIRLPIKNRLFKDRGQAQTLSIRMSYLGATTSSANIFIRPGIASVSFLLYREVKLPIKLSQLRLYDGEVHWKHPDISLNRPVRLTPLQGGNPVAIFVHGQNILERGWIDPTAQQQAVIN